MSEESGVLVRADGVGLAWKRIPGLGPTIVFLPGFRSDMEGSKAVFLAGFAAEQGQAMLRLDYSGHGVSGGRFEDGSIGLWTADALAVIDAETEGPLILVGSSMGGWIGLNIALARPDRVIGYIGIAAAPDFTETLIWGQMPPAIQEKLMAEGVVYAPSDYGEPLPLTRRLIEDGRRHLLLGDTIALTCPLRLLQGQQDPDVPWQTALTIAEKVESTDVRVVLIKDGDHRLSRESDLALLKQAVVELLPV
ncbi:alpha/beta hydrolase [Acidisoma cellulosilytica]|uniref:Alpha/beta hydrolase n=1 Tax=Acidisoma cellulosilyticum TaxID=2802395 RepID=A0A963Z3Y6_9PROT|nr:alpha/beta hydrolase [Acidisoma cellulosilyticum]MCB8882337.1 alpha/beta hydrolase [Acidisoma cellulosilyticum]